MSGLSLRTGCSLLIWLVGMHAAAPRVQAQAVVSLSDPAAETSFQLAPGVIVAPHTGSVYVRTLGTGDGIDALDGRSLRVRAHTTQAAVPLLVTNGQLLALSPGNKLQLVWLDAHSLRRNQACAPVELPRWLAASATDAAPGGSTWSADVSDAVYVRFAASTRQVAAAEAQAAGEPLRGTIRVDPESGATELLERAPASAAPASLRLVEPIRAGPFFVQGLSMVVSVLGSEPRRVRVERRRLSDGVRLPALTFVLPAAAGLLSLDRGALWIAEPGAQGAITGARLIGTSKGNELVHVPFAALPEAFLSVGKRAWYVSEEGLGTLELGSGVRGTSRALYGRTPAAAPSNVASALPR